MMKDLSDLFKVGEWHTSLLVLEQSKPVSVHYAYGLWMRAINVF
jgi:hypothetical protein